VLGDARVLVVETNADFPEEFAGGFSGGFAMRDLS
jgi:hypothetical protein